jgi:hypothetical protein
MGLFNVASTPLKYTIGILINIIMMMEHTTDAPPSSWWLTCCWTSTLGSVTPPLDVLGVTLYPLRPSLSENPLTAQLELSGLGPPSASECQSVYFKFA